MGKQSAGAQKTGLHRLGGWHAGEWPPAGTAAGTLAVGTNCPATARLGGTRAGIPWCALKRTVVGAANRFKLKQKAWRPKSTGGMHGD